MKGFLGWKTERRINLSSKLEVRLRKVGILKITVMGKDRDGRYGICKSFPTLESNPMRLPVVLVLMKLFKLW